MKHYLTETHEQNVIIRNTPLKVLYRPHKSTVSVKYALRIYKH